MQALTGVYKLNNDERRTISVRDGKLYTQHGEGPPHALLAASANELYFDEVLDYFTVTSDAAGKVIALEKFPNGEPPVEHWPKTDEVLPTSEPAKK
jgi:hypothetical protein